MKAAFASLGVLAVLVFAAASAAGPSDLMDRKSSHAEKILRSLALGDLGAVEKEAAALETLTVEAGFENRTEPYREYGEQFLKVVRALQSEAKQGNAAGSYYQFSRMTGMCFSCHEHVRDRADEE